MGLAKKQPRSAKTATEGRINSQTEWKGLRRGTSCNFISPNIRNHMLKTCKAILYLYILKNDTFRVVPSPCFLVICLLFQYILFYLTNSYWVTAYAKLTATSGRDGNFLKFFCALCWDHCERNISVQGGPKAGLLCINMVLRREDCAILSCATLALLKMGNPWCKGNALGWKTELYSSISVITSTLPDLPPPALLLSSLRCTRSQFIDLGPLLGDL